MSPAGPPPIIREATDADLDAVAALNAANVPEVGPADRARLERFLAIAEQFLVAIDDAGRLAAFVIVLTEGCDYDSPNYGWFAARYPRFVYVDRIAVDAGHRGAGLARRLYDEVVAVARRRGCDLVCAEVNVQPRNEASLAFHARYGFSEQAEVADPRYQELRVAMLTYRVPAPQGSGPA